MKFFSVIVTLWLLCSSCFAEDNEHPVEITIYSGVSFAGMEDTSPCIFCLDADIPFPLPIFVQQKRHLGNGVLIGIKGAYFLNRHIALEGNFGISPNQKLTSETTFECPPGFVCPALGFPFTFFERNTVAYVYDGNFIYHFLDQNVRPFLSAGIGGISTDVNSDIFTNFTLNFGGGLKYYFRNLGMRFEISDHVITNHWLTDETEHNLQVQYGLLFRL